MLQSVGAAEVQGASGQGSDGHQHCQGRQGRGVNPECGEPPLPCLPAGTGTAIVCTRVARFCVGAADMSAVAHAGCKILPDVLQLAAVGAEPAKPCVRCDAF